MDDNYQTPLITTGDLNLATCGYLFTATDTDLAAWHGVRSTPP